MVNSIKGNKRINNVNTINILEIRADKQEIKYKNFA
jgi:hypothetical protein